MNLFVIVGSLIFFLIEMKVFKSFIHNIISTLILVIKEETNSSLITLEILLLGKKYLKLILLEKIEESIFRIKNIFSFEVNVCSSLLGIFKHFSTWNLYFSNKIREGVFFSFLIVTVVFEINGYFIL